MNVAIVTGAGSGIGRALAVELGRRGESVVLVDRDHGAVTDAAQDVSSTGSRAALTAADIAAPDSLHAAIDLAAEMGHLRTACLNAGVTTTGTTVWETPGEALDLMLRVNLHGLYESLRAVVPAMLRQDRPGRILITASMAGLVSSPASAAYSASKAAVIAVAKALRDELAQAQAAISVTVLNPGMVRTNLMRTSAAQQRPNERMTPELVSAAHDALNTMGVAPEDVARTALDDVDAGRFWSLPGGADPFVNTLREELTELLDRAQHR